MTLLDLLDERHYEVVFAICMCVYSIFLIWSCWIHVIMLCAMYACIREIRKRKRTLLESNSKAVLITGCDTGFGHHLAKRLDDHGFTVFAGVLSDSGEGAHALRSRKSKRLHVLQLDVTSDNDVKNATKAIHNECGEKGLWGLVNNAGFYTYADIEFATIEQYKKCHEVNLYGVIRVTKACLPYIRKAKGRIVNISSARGLIPWPSLSIYHTSKHSVETLSDSLRIEMRKFGVKVAVVEPGHFSGATSVCSQEQIARLTKEVEISWEASSDDVKTTYGREYIDYVRAALRRDDIPVTSPDPVLNAIEDALLNIAPRTRYLVFGNSGWILDQLSLLASTYNYLPTWLSDYIIAWMTKCDRTITNTTKKN